VKTPNESPGKWVTKWKFTACPSKLAQSVTCSIPRYVGFLIIDARHTQKIGPRQHPACRRQPQNRPREQDAAGRRHQGWRIEHDILAGNPRADSDDTAAIEMQTPAEHDILLFIKVANMGIVEIVPTDRQAERNGIDLDEGAVASETAREADMLATLGGTVSFPEMIAAPAGPLATIPAAIARSIRFIVRYFQHTSAVGRNGLRIYRE
jgi:hypothetical protein